MAVVDGRTRGRRSVMAIDRTAWGADATVTDRTVRVADATAAGCRACDVIGFGSHASAECGVARATGAARALLMAGMSLEARDRCSLLGGRDSSIRSFGSARQSYIVSLEVFFASCTFSFLYPPAPPSDQSYGGRFETEGRRTEEPDCPPNICATPPIIELPMPPELCGWVFWPLW